MTIDLPDVLAQLRQPAVRDLAWTLLSPALLPTPPSQQRHPLAASRWGTHPGLLVDWLRHQDEEPSRLLDWLSRGSIRRLGLYYEKLWQFALAQAPDIELLAANLPVRVAGHTLGEFDLVLRDPAGLQHCELAVKFYLCLAGADPERDDSWLGPGGCDRLDIKLERLLQHQLLLSEHEAGRATLRELVASAPQASFWLGGYRFVDRDADARAQANDANMSSGWRERHAWAPLLAQSPQSWALLPRAAWLAPARFDAQPAPLSPWLASLPAVFQPYLLVALEPAADGWHERERCFVVPDGWPSVIQPLA